MNRDDWSLKKFRRKPPFMVGVHLMDKKSFSVFEGDTDIAFYKGFIEGFGSKAIRDCEQTDGKGKIETGISTYRNAKIGNSKYKHTKAYADMSFCMDRDYDVYLHKRIFREPYVYYQMWENPDNVSSGYNDLECFLISTKVLEVVLKEYGISPERVDSYREELISVASYVGAVRIANRKAQYSTMGPDKKVPPPPLRHEGSELGVKWFIDRGFIGLCDGKLSFSSNGFYKRILDEYLPYNMDTPEGKRTIVALDELKTILDDYFEPSIGYCRGHDLVELLFRKLGRDPACKNPPRSMNDLEESLLKLPPPGEARNDILKKLQTFPIFNDFDKETFEMLQKEE